LQAGPSANQQAFAHLAQQASNPSAPQQPFAQQPFSQQPFAQQPFAQPPFAQPPLAQQFAAQQTAAQQAAALEDELAAVQQVAALEDQLAAVQASALIAARGRRAALELLDDGGWTYVKRSSNPRDRILDLI